MHHHNKDDEPCDCTCNHLWRVQSGVNEKGETKYIAQIAIRLNDSDEPHIIDERGPYDSEQEAENCATAFPDGFAFSLRLFEE